MSRCARIHDTRLLVWFWFSRVVLTKVSVGADRSRNAVRTHGADPVILSGAADFIVPVFFNAFNDDEDPGQPGFDVRGQIHGIEGGTHGA